MKHNNPFSQYCNTYVYPSYGDFWVIACDTVLLPDDMGTITAANNWTATSLAVQEATQIPSSSSMTMGLTTMMMPTKASTSSISATPATTPALPATTRHENPSTGEKIGIAIGMTLLGCTLLILAFLLWRRHTTPRYIPPPHGSSSPEIQVASYASPTTSPSPLPTTSPSPNANANANASTNPWAPAAIGGKRNEKSPSYGYEAQRIGIQPDCAPEVNAHEPPAWAPPRAGGGDGDVNADGNRGGEQELLGISELGGGESREPGEG
ncbi:hypothetical protein NHQ30_005401 [Ciborinia camelliae]|nr:hypothetical protein NHQ30_005401 [Ciborinia camelliae]